MPRCWRIPIALLLRCAIGDAAAVLLDSTCANTCEFAGDGICDDGGAHSQFALCAWDTDCRDCGGSRPKVADEGLACSNVCSHASDGECDDGGPTSNYNECSLGSDCADCGPGNRPRIRFGCQHSCAFSRDGSCDDGGQGSEYEECGFGTDCSDCGSRLHDSELHINASHGFNSDASAEHACDNTCFYSRDGKCDDGGYGAEFHECALGSDCADCGSDLRHRQFATPEPPPPTSPSPALPPYDCLLEVLLNLRELPVPRSCPALGEADCHQWRMNNLRCAWIARAGSGSGTCKAGGEINCNISPPPPLPPNPELPSHFNFVEMAAGQGLCENSCPLASDGACDDGGPGALFTDCPYGTDCTDCEERLPSFCSNTCVFHDDGVCDDGIAEGGAQWDECAVGTDCTDCGPRPGKGLHLPRCRDSCVWSQDQSCDDGGNGSTYELCDIGTDWCMPGPAYCPHSQPATECNPHATPYPAACSVVCWP